MACTYHRRSGFTLIELLVVIAIIAVLISLLLPALKAVKRGTKLVQCQSHLKSYALGLTIYATEDRTGTYPSNSLGGWGDILKVWTSVSSLYPSDFNAWLSMFDEVVCGGDMRILWCPLDTAYAKYVGPGKWLSGHPDWPWLWYDDRFGINFIAGYNRMANLSGISSWSESGNSQIDGPPLGPGSAQDAILSDIQGTQHSYLFNVHMAKFAAYSEQDLQQQRDNNVAYADGHVETHGGRAQFVGGYAFYPGSHWIPRTGTVHRYIY